MNTEKTIEQYYLKAADLCSKSEKCSNDIREKLQQWGADQQMTEQLIQRLQSEKFIDDARYAGYFVKDKFRFNKWGRVKIAYMLRMKRVAPVVIDEALTTIDEEEYCETLENLIRQKAPKTTGKTVFEKKAKLLRFGQSHGFESSYIFPIIEKILTSR